MARNRSRRGPRIVRQSDTLMPVSPNREQSSESLSHNGETVAVKDQEINTGEGAQAPARGIPEDIRREVESDDGGDDTGDDDGVMEARVARGKKPPKDPTRKEREEHELTHMPFRSWCEDCVKSKARNAHLEEVGSGPPRRGQGGPCAHGLLLHVKGRRVC